jgi:hypothetical protein
MRCRARRELAALAHPFLRIAPAWVPQNGSVLKSRCPCRVPTCPGRGCLFDRDPTLVPDHVQQERPEPQRRSPSALLLWVLAIIGCFAAATYLARL